jgi:hypothetical protein
MNPHALTANVTADAVIKGSPGLLVGVHLLAGSGATGSIVLYDNASAASGTILATLQCTQGLYVSWTPAIPQIAHKGIYADWTGTGAVAVVAYI